jgi:hypothetical protein
LDGVEPGDRVTDRTDPVPAVDGQGVVAGMAVVLEEPAVEVVVAGADVGDWGVTMR